MCSKNDHIDFYTLKEIILQYVESMIIYTSILLEKLSFSFWYDLIDFYTLREIILQYVVSMIMYISILLEYQSSRM